MCQIQDQQKRKRALILAFIFFLFCIFVDVGVYWPARELRNLRREYELNEAQRANIQKNIEDIYEQNQNLSQLSDKFIEKNHISTSSGIVEFYSQAQEIFQNRNINIISTRQQDDFIVLRLEGDYYAFTDSLADFRAMPTAVKVFALKIQRSKIAPGKFIEADITLGATF